MNRTFEWGVDIATFLFGLSVVPHHCACLTDFLHPKLRESNAVLITARLITLALRRAGSNAISTLSSGPRRDEEEWMLIRTIVQGFTLMRVVGGSRMERVGKLPLLLLCTLWTALGCPAAYSRIH